jgi:hypothetical protein
LAVSASKRHSSQPPHISNTNIKKKIEIVEYEEEFKAAYHIKAAHLLA